METDSANPASGSDSATVSDPVDMIANLLEREDNPPTDKPRDPKGKYASQAPTPEPTEPEDAPVDPGPEVPPVDPDGEDEDGEAPEQPEQQDEPEPEKFAVKVDGKTIEVTRDELLNGYQRDADYRQKTMALSQSRQAVEAEAQRIQAERQHYATQLDQLASVLQTALPPRPTDEMLQTDPFGYIQAKEHWEGRVGQLQQVLQERDRAQQLNQQQQAAQQQQMLQQAKQQLVEMLPEWQKPEVAQKEQPLIAQHLRAIGYADHEIGAAADPRAILMARESMLYRQMVAQKATVQQRVASAPKMVRPGTSGPAPDKTKQITQQIRRSGGKDIDAIARLIDLG
jgi:hypothetical protein